MIYRLARSSKGLGNRPASRPVVYRSILLLIVAVPLFMTGLVGGTPPTGKFSMTSGGFASAWGIKASTPPSTQSAQGTTLVATLNLGDVSPTNWTSRVKITMPVRVSATADYKIQVQSQFNNTHGGFTAADIGFGALNFRSQNPASSHLMANAVSGMIAAGNFGSNPFHAPVVNGKPQFAATLSDISPSLPTTVVTGPATTTDAFWTQDDGSILIDLTFVVVPQYFSPTDNFNLVLTFTILPA